VNRIESLVGESVANARVPRRVMAGLWGVALLAGLLHVWPRRFALNNLDAVSYLDLADAWRLGRWGDAVNAYWSPAYSWALAAALAVVRPSAEHQYVLLHAVNVVLFIAALAALHLLVTELVRDTPGPDTASTFSPAGFATMAFLLFTWFAVTQLSVATESPDLIPTAATFAAGALLVRLRHRPGTMTTAALGGILGAGYLGKAAMLPVAPVFILAAAMAARSWRVALVATAALAAVAGPWILALSMATGRFNTGDAGRINYLWLVNRSDDWPRHWPPHWPHWDGVEGRGEPLHPARRLHTAPAVYEFATPFTAATYPMWFAPAYWYEGVSPRFDLRDQLRRLRMSAADYLRLLTVTRDQPEYFNPQPALAALLLALWLAGSAPTRWRVAWHVLLPAAAILGTYALVRVAPRYVAGGVILTWVILLAGVRLERGEAARRLARAAQWTAGGILALSIAVVTISDTWARWSRMGGGDLHVSNPDWYLASRLQRAGLAPGTTVGVIGNAQVASRWARLAGVRIVAEVPAADVEQFTEGDDATVRSVIAAFAQTPARFVLAERPPLSAPADGWRRVTGTPYWLFTPEPR